MSTYAIGDIQGCYNELCDLLALVGFDPGADRLWLVGDLVNRGPDSLEVLRFVKGLGERVTVVLGNHDLHLVMRDAGFGRESKDDTIESILVAPDREELMAWLRIQPLFHVEGEYAMVHAGLLPHWTVGQALELSDEVSAALSRKKRYIDFLENMWGSKPDHWDEEFEGWDRLRVIVNAMTRMRFCSQDGVMEFHAKGKPDNAPAGYMPWFAVPQRASLTHTLVCGHWSALGLRTEEKLLALDTGCLWGGQLTAVRLEDRKVFQVPSRQPPGPWAD
jgi:bis(5'-nucleosyl)-tetraphosphatase (symmetrical)